jgi:D-sedoheptulose 7-phosphate isomerase
MIYSCFESARQENLAKFEEYIVQTSNRLGKIIFVGNGGSAAIASHVSVDFTKAAKIRAINFNEANLLTCFSNDYGYENWVSEALLAYADPKDLLVLISSSGTSKNIVNGAVTAKKMGLDLVTFTGFNPNNETRQFGDINFWVDSTNYNIVEMTHQLWILSVHDKMCEVEI